MSANKKIDRICISIVAVTIVIAILFCCGKAFGIETNARVLGYENRIFDNSKVHSFDIVIDDWDSFIATCESETYSVCTVIIDGESVKNVGIRGKGNTSLSSVKSMNSSRYSFKIEFDQYDSTKSYHGLDKLCLNNIIQDNTYMKDYLAYTLMNEFGVDAPLCSFVYVTVNGEEWGLYLAVEAIEDSFLQRNYGNDYGDLYKPDSMSFGGGGPGNGKDFNMTDFINQNTPDEENDDVDENNEKENNKNESQDRKTPGNGGFEGRGFGGFGGFGGMGSDDVKLKYTDDNIDSYSNIFGNAKTTVTQADKNRLIASLKALYEQTDIENTVDVDEVIRYFVVHNFLCNGDSYTGSMIHNYYLYEKDGKLSMIPWDYNLAYGSFQGGKASSSVNAAIDTPVSGDMSDRPMIAWIFGNDEYTLKYHEYFEEFINSTDIVKMIEDTAELIDKYVEKDPTKFCTYEEFIKGVEAIKQFCSLRSESVKGQLNGTIPSTTAGQNSDNSNLVDASDLNTSDMGSMGGNRGGFGDNNAKNRGDFRGERKSSNQESGENTSTMTAMASSSRPERGNMPEGFNPGQFGDGEMPEGFDPTQFGGGNMPEDFDPTQFGGGNMPEGIDPTQFGDGNNSEKGKVPFDKSDMTNRQSQNKNGFNNGSFFGFSGSGQNSDMTEYILLGSSAAVLIAGLLFAAIFKRRGKR